MFLTISTMQCTVGIGFYVKFRNNNIVLRSGLRIKEINPLGRRQFEIGEKLGY